MSYDFPEDVERIARVLSKHLGVVITHEDACTFWRDTSQ